MPIQYSVAARTAVLEGVRATLGAGFSLEVRTGPPPANCAAADSGTLLVTFTASFAPASAGAMALSGTPLSATAAAAGTMGHFRMKNGAVCVVQGTVAVASGDMTVDNATVTAGQAVNQNGYTLTAGGA